jgi:hypothetical protein
MTRYRLTSKHGDATYAGTRDKAKRYCQALANALHCDVVMTPIAAPKRKPARKRKASTKRKPARRRVKRTAKRVARKRSTRRPRRSASVKQRRKGRR